LKGLQHASFSRTQLNMKTYLIILAGLLLTTCASSNIIKEKLSFEDLIISGQDVFIKDQTFNNDIDFTQFEKNLISESVYQVRIVSSVTFLNCTFNGKVIAYKKNEDKTSTLTSFQSNLSFIGCVFNEEVSFRASSVLGRTDFTKASFSKTSSFEECTFFQNAYFRGSTYHEELRFQNAVFIQKANFLNAEFDVTASFQHTIFHAEAQFSSTRFMGYTDFSSITSHGNFYANYAEFADRAFFNNSFFNRQTELNNIKFNYCEIKNCRFFGTTRFEKTTVQDHIFFDHSFFLLGGPDTPTIEPEKISLEGVIVNQ